MTNFLDKLKERMDAVTASVSDTFGHAVVPEEVHAERLNTCMGCEHLFAPTSQCKKCGCFVKVKTRIAMFSCPISKWPTYSIPVQPE